MAKDTVHMGDASPIRPNIAKIIKAGATQNEIESDIISSDPPSNLFLEYRRAIGPSIISPNADNKMHNIAAQI